MSTTTTIVPITIVIAVFLTIAVFIHSDDISSSFANTISCSSQSNVAAPALKVFMYDLPRRFNIDMLGAVSVAGAGLPSWPGVSGLKKQHSVEYWMMASLLDGGSGDGAEAVRVFDPDDAEVLFVPFFSSLSLITHGRNNSDPQREIDRQLQIDLVDILQKSPIWKRSAGRDHVIPMTHPNAFKFLRNQVNASILVVVDFDRYPVNVASLKKDIVAPYVHVVDSFLDDDHTDPFESRPTLLFFRGRTNRKDEGVVRLKLSNLLKGYKDVRYEDSYATGEGIRTSSQGMQSSKFCLHPAGDTPSSCRLFDAIVSHCVPVIVSDRIELPFEDEIDYSEFSLFFSVKEALQPNFLVNELRQFQKERWLEMWRRLKSISHHYEFQYPTKRNDAVNMIWKQVRHKLPAVKLSQHRNKRLKIPDWWS